MRFIDRLKNISILVHIRNVEKLLIKGGSFMNFIYKNLLALALLTSGFAVVAEDTQASAPVTKKPTYNEALNIALETTANSELAKQVGGVAHCAANYACDTYVHYINPIKMFETPADRLGFVLAAWLTGVTLQASYELYHDWMYSDDDRGYFEWLFSFKDAPGTSSTSSKKRFNKPSNAMTTLVVASGVALFGPAALSAVLKFCASKIM